MVRFIIKFLRPYDLNYADHITQIKQQLGSGEAVSDYTYDAYGNIIKTTLPANSKGQRMWYTYRYEPVMICMWSA